MIFLILAAHCYSLASLLRFFHIKEIYRSFKIVYYQVPNFANKTDTDMRNVIDMVMCVCSICTGVNIGYLISFHFVQSATRTGLTIKVGNAVI